jgi:hypothetical protein
MNQPTEASASSLQIPIEIAFRDVGTLTLDTSALANALVDALHRHLGWYGKPEPAEATRRIEAIGRQREDANQIAAEWQRVSGAVVSEWVRALFMSELLARMMPLDRLIAWVEEEVSAGRYVVFAAPTVQAKLHAARADRGLPRSQRDQIKRIGRHLSKLASGRHITPTEDLEAVKILRRHEKGEKVMAIAKSRGQSQESIRAQMSRARKRVAAKPAPQR